MVHHVRREYRDSRYRLAKQEMSEKEEVPIESPWTPSVAEKFENKPFSKHYDPCQEAADRSIKCVHRNAGHKEFCNDYFQAYRDCKKAWIEARRESRRQERLNKFSF